MRCVFHPEALEEYEAAARYYAERDLAVALRLIESVEETLDRIQDAPQRWRTVDEDVRRCLTHLFPYAILYTIEDDFILVVAVMHCSREPGYWKERHRS